MRRGLGIVVLAGSLALLPATVQAQFGWCNQGSTSQKLAFGYLQDGEYVSTGWSERRPGGCDTVLYDADLPPEVFWFSAAPGFVGDGYAFCVEDGDFIITGDADCEARGFRTANFRMQRTKPALASYVMNIGEDGAIVDADLPVIDLSRPFSPAAPAPAAAGERRFVSGLAEGANGPAFQLEGIFQGCEIPVARPFCAFHAEGWKFFAWWDGPTPAAMLEDLRGVALNTPVTVSGDVVNEGDLYADVALREVVAHDSDPFAGLRAAIQGDWVSADDPKFRMTVHGSEIYETYDGQDSGVRFLRIAADCAESAGQGPVLVTETVPDGDATCFLFQPADAGQLVLAVAGQGGFVSFLRPR